MQHCILAVISASASAYAPGIAGHERVAVLPAASARVALPIVNLLGVRDDASGRACLLLPYNPFPGPTNPMLLGEVQLQELEDDMECRTQLFLNPDGTVGGGATDGPLPDAICGFWQSGGDSFQMTIQRTFATEVGMHSDGSSIRGGEYTVTRVYLGSVDPSRGGNLLVEGRMIFYDQGPIATDPPFPFPKSGGDLSFVDMLGASAIGFFNIDAQMEAMA